MCMDKSHFMTQMILQDWSTTLHFFCLLTSIGFCKLQTRNIAFFNITFSIVTFDIRPLTEKFVKKIKISAELKLLDVVAYLSIIHKGVVKSEVFSCVTAFHGILWVCNVGGYSEILKVGRAILLFRLILILGQAVLEFRAVHRVGTPGSALGIASRYIHSSKIWTRTFTLLRALVLQVHVEAKNEIEHYRASNRCTQ